MAEIEAKTTTEDVVIPDEKSDMENSWVLFELDQVHYGIRSEYIREMALFKEPSKVPDYPSHMRGVINLRGMVIPVIDLRKKLGKRALLEESESLMDTLQTCEQDHINWLNELKASVEENRKFTLATDPHACQFGKWYDNFTTENHQLKTQLKKFEEPHEACHRVAVEVEELENEGKKDEALALIQHAGDTKLAILKRLFEETIRIIKESLREIVIVVESRNMSVGFVVDRVIEVTDINPEDIEGPPKIKNGIPSRFIQGLARIEEEVKILLNVDELIFGDDLEYAEGVSETQETKILDGAAGDKAI